MHTYIHTCIHTYIHTCIHTYTHIHTCIHTYIHTYIHACTHTYIRTFGYVCGGGATGFWSGMSHAAPDWAFQIFVWSYLIIVFFILFNVLLAILIDTYCEIKGTQHPDAPVPLPPHPPRALSLSHSRSRTRKANASPFLRVSILVMLAFLLCFLCHPPSSFLSCLPSFLLLPAAPLPPLLDLSQIVCSKRTKESRVQGVSRGVSRCTASFPRVFSTHLCPSFAFPSQYFASLSPSPSLI